MFDTLTLSNLRHRSCGVVRGASSTRPAIWVVEENGIRAVVKDFSVNKFLFRNLAGRFLVWRESKAYRRLIGLDGVPRLYKVIDGLALVFEAIPGRNLESLGPKTRLPDSFFDALNELVDRFHQRGVAHCDLKRAPNTLVGDDDRPYIVDWAASICETEFRFPLLNRIYQRFVLDDRLAVIKLKLRHRPDLVTPEERTQYAYRSRGEKVIRSIRDRLREWLQKAA